MQSHSIAPSQSCATAPITDRPVNWAADAPSLAPPSATAPIADPETFDALLLSRVEAALAEPPPPLRPLRPARGVHVFGNGPAPRLKPRRNIATYLVAISAGALAAAFAGLAASPEIAHRVANQANRALTIAKSTARPAAQTPTPAAETIVYRPPVGPPAEDNQLVGAFPATAQPPEPRSAGEVESALQHAADLLQRGDIAATRLVLEHVLDAGDPRILIALANSYDPLVLRRIGTRGLAADSEKARQFYAMASQAGIRSADLALAALDTDAPPASPAAAREPISTAR